MYALLFLFSARAVFVFMIYGGREDTIAWALLVQCNVM